MISVTCLTCDASCAEASSSSAASTGSAGVVATNDTEFLAGARQALVVSRADDE